MSSGPVQPSIRARLAGARASLTGLAGVRHALSEMAVDIAALNARADEAGRRAGGIEEGLTRLDRRESQQEIALTSLTAEVTLIREQVEALRADTAKAAPPAEA